MKTVKQIANDLLERGWREFIGSGLVVEIATQNLPPDETCTLTPSDTSGKVPLGPLGASVGNWEYFGRILADETFTTETRLEHASEPPLVPLDYAVATLAGTKPGSAERIEALRNLYAPAADEIENLAAIAKKENIAAPDPINQPTGFDMPIELIADKLAALGLDYDDDGTTVNAVQRIASTPKFAPLDKMNDE